MAGDDGGQRRELLDGEAERLATVQVPPLGEGRIGHYGMRADLQEHAGVGHPGHGEKRSVAHAVTMQVDVRMKSTMTIGELAGRFELPTHVLRHWESAGLLTPVRQPSGHRRYGSADLRRVATILMGKEAGLGLRDLSRILSSPDPMRHAGLLREHLAVLERRIARAQAAKDLIEHALDCPLSFDECPHAHEQIEARIPSQASSRREGRAAPRPGDPGT
ncbi:MerR family transcriptional regulator [Streptosporangium sp. NPDC050855]|uniref:MerR family transcriptional regulator n=1 Tax=Streptosporangium sp. NPDC050855 TaxID=3366194 RepID=UPI00379D32ED